jgi:hypothetical protein
MKAAQTGKLFAGESRGFDPITITM